MKVIEYLKNQKVPFELHEHSPTYTAQEVAAEEHVSGNFIAKTVLVRADGNYVLCVLPASYKLDLAKVARIVKAKDVRLADETELAKISPDTEVGAEPPFGNLYDISTLVDDHLVSEEHIIFQAGTHRQAVKIKYHDYARLAQPKTADLAVHL